MSANAFKPQGNSAALAVTSTSTATPIQVNGNMKNATERLIYNAGPNDCWLAAAATAAAAVAVVPTAGSPALGTVIPAKAVLVLGFPVAAFFAAISKAGETATLYITPGEGV